MKLLRSAYLTTNTLGPLCLPVGILNGKECSLKIGNWLKASKFILANQSHNKDKMFVFFPGRRLFLLSHLTSNLLKLLYTLCWR